MTKSFKLGCVYLAALVSLTLARLIFGFVNLSDNLSNWLFSVVMQCGFMGLMPYLMIKFISPKDAGFRDSVYLKASHLKPVTYLYAVAIGLLGFVLNVGVSSLSRTAACFRALWKNRAFPTARKCSSWRCFSGWGIRTFCN